jgi:hypothetical protein
MEKVKGKREKLYLLPFTFLWWAARDSNPEPVGYEPIALPLS